MVLPTTEDEQGAIMFLHVSRFYDQHTKTPQNGAQLRYDPVTCWSLGDSFLADGNLWEGCEVLKMSSLSSLINSAV